MTDHFTNVYHWITDTVVALTAAYYPFIFIIGISVYALGVYAIAAKKDK